MKRRLIRLLISTVFIVILGAPTSSVFADSLHSNAADAPGHTKTTSNNQTQQTSNQPTSQTSIATSSFTPGNSNHSQGNASTTGSFNQPQPFSIADQNNTGANNTTSSNPYTSTRNGSPSLNGNGNGQATGKPCAGCVGKADNKNPKGQAPNGSDHNSGYECDRNNGIGKTNPAHTGCVGIPGVCTTNCSPNSCQVLTCGGGRGGEEVLKAHTVAMVVRGTNALPNTGAHDDLSLWMIFATVSLIAGVIYWRELVVSLLLKA